ncbi:MAG: RdgB/HAM1 family non-canonical purine NTP pyrophosphatase [Candidatus Omnitrophica bacterium]|nr:RdgB/HAM1 family non-canonical purine NTP pyrophosphatase [Candidatus Omnitrophota bacterium]
MELVVATRNQDKLKEISALLRGLPLEVVSLDNFRNVPEVIENGRTLEANAKKKAVHVSRFLGRFVVADDSGLEIEALGKEPGVHSARFSGKGATYASNNKKVLKLLNAVPRAKRTAVFRCVIAVADRGKMVGLAEGRCRGRIGFRPIGRTGFGYDPIFVPYGYKKTFAQLGLKKKNRISHRSRALIEARKIIKRYVLTHSTLLRVNFLEQPC